MNIQTQFANLRNILAELYMEETSARRIAADVGLDNTRIPFSSRAIDNWHAILTEAKNTHRLDILLGIVMGEYNNLRLQDAWNNYRSAIQPDLSAVTLEKHAALKDSVDPLSKLLAVFDQEPLLHSAVESQTFALFIGSDLDSHITGVLSRRELAHGLAEKFGFEPTESLADVAQWASRLGNRFGFTQYIRDVLEHTQGPQPYHHTLASIIQICNIQTIITTSYDNLLEAAMMQAGISFNRIVGDMDIAFIKTERPSLIKLYGDIQQPETLIVTKQDHFNLLRQRKKEALLNEVLSIFRRNTVLFVGYNLTDPDFHFLFEGIGQDRFARIAYAIWPGISAIDQEMWQDRGIRVLDADPFTQRPSIEIDLED